MKLISMTDFILKLSNNDSFINMLSEEKGFEKYWVKTFNYALFLQRPLTLDMFVHCDDEENVIIKRPEPQKLSENVFSYTKQNIWDSKHTSVKDKVLFKGLGFEENIGKEKSYFDILKSIYPTVESLVDFKDVELTDYAIKKLGL